MPAGLCMVKCDFPQCSSEGSVVSRLSPKGFLVATGNKAYSFREAYKRFTYCDKCHDELMKSVWNRVREADEKGDDHVAPTAI
tara:strand:+ start:378 stop:626 length:249 start_codon:yes stop_codon:yes gene_type:complete